MTYEPVFLQLCQYLMLSSLYCISRIHVFLQRPQLLLFGFQKQQRIIVNKTQAEDNLSNEKMKKLEETLQQRLILIKKYTLANAAFIC